MAQVINLAVQVLSIKCASSQHYAEMWQIFAGLMPPNQGLLLEQLTPSRSKKIGKGKCAWTISVSSTVLPVTTKAEYNVVKELVLSNSPINGKLAMSGRYAERGICATYYNTNCQCILDFDCTPTLSPVGQRIMAGIGGLANVATEKEKSKDYSDKFLELGMMLFNESEKNVPKIVDGIPKYRWDNVDGDVNGGTCLE